MLVLWNCLVDDDKTFDTDTHGVRRETVKINEESPFGKQMLSANSHVTQ